MQDLDITAAIIMRRSRKMVVTRLFITYSFSLKITVKSRKMLTFTSPTPNSLYLYGGTGCGKTYLMDLFYDTLPITGTHSLTHSPTNALIHSLHSGKRRIHFHNFMIDIHKRLHAYRMRNNASGGEKKIKGLRYIRLSIHSVAHSLPHFQEL